MTLWIRYMQRPSLPTLVGIYLQPWNYEIYYAGKTKRYVVLSGEATCWLSTDSKDELRMRLELAGMKLGEFIGFSEFQFDWKDMLWRGYKLDSV